MNYLAHLYLAQHSDDAMLGAILGDFARGSELQHYLPEVQREIHLHRRVDSYADAHPRLLELKHVFPQGRRRFSGILLDVYFDHLLARDWRAHHSQPLHEFSQRAYRVLLRDVAALPLRLQQIAPRMSADDWLGRYRERDSVDGAVTRIAQRLSRSGDQLLACLPILRRHEVEAEAAFARFFPELQTFAARTRQQLSPAA